MSSQAAAPSLDEGLLNSSEGLCYVVGFDGSILAIGERNWNKAVSGTGAVHLNAEAMIGANIFECMSGEEIVFAYRRYLWDFLKGRREEVSFPFRCDSPNRRRDLKMKMSAVYENDRPIAVMFQSLVLSEKRRARINLLDTAYMKEVQVAEGRLPLITLCSFCHAVKRRAADVQWQPLEVYFGNGGDDRVRVGHGICPFCFEAHHARG